MLCNIAGFVLIMMIDIVIYEHFEKSITFVCPDKKCLHQSTNLWVKPWVSSSSHEKKKKNLFFVLFVQQHTCPRVSSGHHCSLSSLPPTPDTKQGNHPGSVCCSVQRCEGSFGVESTPCITPPSHLPATFPVMQQMEFSPGSREHPSLRACLTPSPPCLSLSLSLSLLPSLSLSLAHSLCSLTHSLFFLSLSLFPLQTESEVNIIPNFKCLASSELDSKNPEKIQTCRLARQPSPPVKENAVHLPALALKRRADLELWSWIWYFGTDKRTVASEADPAFHPDNWLWWWQHYNSWLMARPRRGGSCVLPIPTGQSDR